MSRWLTWIAATVLLGACPAGVARPPRAPGTGDQALRLRVAAAEARRVGGVAELEALASRGPASDRALALRGLGRIGAIGATGGARVAAALLGALGDPDPAVVGAAAGALGLAGALDDGDLGATEALVAALPRAPGPVIEALGRAGSAAAQPALVSALADRKLAELAALALGRHGRRKLALSDAARSALAVAAGSTDPAVRYAAVYALAREHQPPGDPAVVTALVQRLGDPAAETRAQAIAALGRRKAIAVALHAGARLDALLLDRDWRVAVEAVRALADTDDGKDAIAAAVARRFDELARGEPTWAHVILESEKALAGAGQRPVVAAALRALLASVSPGTAGPAAAELPALARGWIACLATVAIERARPDPALTAVAHCPLADHLRLPLVAELVSANVGSVAARRAALAELLGHADPRVRAAGLGAIAALWPAGDLADHREALTALTAAVAAPDAVVAGAAIEAATGIYAAVGAGDHAALDAAVIARAASERDPELGAAVLELVGKRGLAGGRDACRAALGGDPVRAKAAVACLVALGEPSPVVTASIANPPPVDVSTVIGKVLRWHVTTTRGELVIRLRPEVAPWAVAAIVALTRKGFYEGVAFHRVVPNFVVQGGDPTESGSGGPGFSLPAEPAALGDGPGYLAGGVGIADAGRDSGGSQWFVMHSRAPHLDGRYTWFGTVESGQNVADALLIGDRVVHAAIDERGE